MNEIMGSHQHRDDYRGLLDAHLVEVSRPHQTLVELTRLARGASITSVRDRASALGLRLTPDAVGSRPEAALIREVPETHPLDYEWYFTASTSRMLAERFVTATTIICIGAPTIAAAIADLGLEVTLVDRNPLVAKRLAGYQNIHVRVADARSWVPAKRVQAVFLDPPWYPRDVELWLRRALQCVEVGGSIMMPIFGELLRPGAEEERARVLELAEHVGELAVAKDAAIYTVPLFEAEALRARGIAPSGAWRSADVLTIHVAENREIANGASTGLSSDLEWETFVIGEQVVKLRLGLDAASTHRALLPVPGLAGLVLPSVSRRHPMRDRVGLWTSRNRVAAVANTESVAHALRVLAANESSWREQNAESLGLSEDDSRLLLEILDLGGGS